MKAMFHGTPRAFLDHRRRLDSIRRKFIVGRIVDADLIRRRHILALSVPHIPLSVQYIPLGIFVLGAPVCVVIPATLVVINKGPKGLAVAVVYEGLALYFNDIAVRGDYRLTSEIEARTQPKEPVGSGASP